MKGITVEFKIHQMNQTAIKQTTTKSVFAYYEDVCSKVLSVQKICRRLGNLIIFIPHKNKNP